MKKALLMTAINLAILASLLYVIELFLFIYDPRRNLPFDGYVGGDLYTWGHLIVNNEQGFRERSIPTSKNSDDFRVMVLGDSLTWGAGLSVKERYTDILEEMLNESFPKNIKVYNFGLSGGTTAEQRDVLQKYKEVVRPDLVIVGFCENDPEPVRQEVIRRRNEARRSYLVVSEARDWLVYIGMPRLGKLFHEGAFTVMEQLGWLPSWLEVQDASYDKGSSDWKTFSSALTDIKEITEELGIPAPIFSVLNRGIYKDKPTDYNNPDEALTVFLKWYRQAESEAAASGFYTVNSETSLAREYANKVMAVNELDEHPNADLNRIYAQNIYDTISKLVSEGEIVIPDSGW